MSRRIIAILGLTATLIGNVGCCAWSDRWCHRNQQPAPQCCPAPAPACYPAQAPQCAPAYAPPPTYCPPPGYNGPYR